MNQLEMIAMEKDKIQKAIQSSDIEKVYFNGFSTSIGVGDILITLFKNGEPIKLLNTSFTVAKTLAIKLNEAVQIVEEKTGNTIMTSDFIQSKLVESEKK
jgi:predicted KAP-like P-loop ATPase